jgi:dienelactone hydrolase
MTSPDPLDDFTRSDFTGGGFTKAVYRSGTGPAVIVFAEIPGITPQVAAFARRVRDLGTTVVLPQLFGRPGVETSMAAAMRVYARNCVRSEFASFAVDRTAPINAWNVALARSLHAECGGPGVGALGMCFTGGFALAMMIDASVVAPVLSQPSSPVPIGKRRAAALPVSRADLATVRSRVDAGCAVLGLRFTGDSFVGTRFDTLREELGDGFIAVEIDSSPGNAAGNPKDAHSVLTRHLVDEPGHPTRAALDQVLGFLRTRLALPG